VKCPVKAARKSTEDRKDQADAGCNFVFGFDPGHRGGRLDLGSGRGRRTIRFEEHLSLDYRR